VTDALIPLKRTWQRRAILRVLRETDTPLSARQISTATQVLMQTTQQSLRVMEQRGWVYAPPFQMPRHRGITRYYLLTDQARPALETYLQE
jgi:DNA-binding transcriptional ArsR family regulator